jgi:hypothetical protein
MQSLDQTAIHATAEVSRYHPRCQKYVFQVKAVLFLFRAVMTGQCLGVSYVKQMSFLRTVVESKALLVSPVSQMGIS